MKKLVVAGACVLALGGGGWALAQVTGPQSQRTDPAAAADDEEDEVSGFIVRDGQGDGHPGGVTGGGDDPVGPTGDGVVTPSGGIAMPHLRPGLWEVTNDANPELSAQTCLDEAIQGEFSLYGSQLHSPFCKAPTAVRRDGQERWSYTNVCGAPKVMTMRVTGVIEGDLRTRYVHTMNTDATAIMGVRESSTNVERGRYVGRCPANMAPGDVMMNGVVMMNVRQAMDLGQVMMPGAFGGMPDSFTPAPEVE